LLLRDEELDARDDANNSAGTGFLLRGGFAIVKGSGSKLRKGARSMGEKGGSAARAYVALYTSHKTRKHKVWHDGVVKLTSRGVVQLLDECGGFLEADARLRDAQDLVQEGAEFELGTFLVQVETQLEPKEHLPTPPPKVNEHNKGKPTREQNQPEQPLRSRTVVEADQKQRHALQDRKPQAFSDNPPVATGDSVRLNATRPQRAATEWYAPGAPPPEHGRDLEQVLQLIDAAAATADSDDTAHEHLSGTNTLE